MIEPHISKTCFFFLKKMVLSIGDLWANILTISVLWGSPPGPSSIIIECSFLHLRSDKKGWLKFIMNKPPKFENMDSRIESASDRVKQNFKTVNQYPFLF